MKLLPEVEAQVNRLFSLKLAETKEVITRHFHEFGDKVAVAFSGGKDSEVVLYLCLQINPNVPVVFSNTGVEYPQTLSLIATLTKKWKLNLIVTHPEKSFWDCVEQYGFPSESKHGLTTNQHPKERCCYWLKEKPMLLQIRQNAFLGQFTGITASESYSRMFSARDHGICFHYKSWNICKIHPILYWTPKEVWDFIHEHNLPYNEAYAKGAERIGCMPCTAHKKWEQQMQKVNPKLYRLIKLRKDKQYLMELH